jgi:hypothetical protein
LIYLKNTKKEKIYKEWFDRPLTALYYFDRKVIEESEDIDLLIDYIA